MKYEEFIQAVENGEKFRVSFEKRACWLNHKMVEIDQKQREAMCSTTHDVRTSIIEELYERYKHSVPSERSESHHKSYFRALPEKSLSDEDMMYGESREVARCRLELYLLILFSGEAFPWKESYGSWFWQSPHDPDNIILRSWVFPKKPDEG